VSPAFSARTAVLENAPPGTSFTPIRMIPSSRGVEQIEYDRRTSSSMRTVTCWPDRNANVSRSSAGTANVTATASSVSRSSATTRSGWNVGLLRTGL
jgi:hypothetical protein